MKAITFKRAIIAIAMMLITAASSWAYVFEVDGIYYGKSSDGKRAYVTYKDSNYNSYSGSVKIPSTVTYSGTTYSVTSIGYCAFDGCSGLTSVTIPNSVTEIGRYAFVNCSGLTSVTIPNSVTSIGDSAFYNCSGLTKVTISDIASWCNIDFGDNPLYYAKHLYLNGTEVTNLVIPNSVTSIGYCAFSGCSGLTSVTIPNSVTRIGSSAFSGCSGLTSVTIGNSVTSIGESAFVDCSGLTRVIFNAENCTSMGSYQYPVFKGCSNPTSLSIGENVKTIPSYAFRDYSGLTSVTIPNSVTLIGQAAFDGCTGLTKVEISDLNAWYNISFNGYSSNPLCYAHNLYLNGKLVTNIVVPLSVTKIGDYTFQGCSNLTSVNVHNQVTSIGASAFAGCSKILSFTSQNATPPTVPSEYAFQGMPRSCQLYVPASSKVAYQTATGWTFFTFVNAFGEGDIETIDSDAVKVTTEGGAIRVDGAAGAVAEVYALSGALLYRGTDATIALPRGVYIVKVAGTTTKVML